MVALGDSTFTTTTCNNSLDPVWEDQTFEFVVCAQGQRLVVNMYDDDTSNTDDFLGRAQVWSRVRRPVHSGAARRVVGAGGV